MAGILWGRSGRVHLSTAREVPAGMRRLERFAVLPTAASPRVLVPLATNRTAGTALRQYNAGMNGPARAAKALASMAMATGLGRMAFRDRLNVWVATDARPEEV